MVRKIKKGFLYLASDGVNDYYKFGITNCLNTRLISYNTTEHLRPIKFIKSFSFDTYKDARDKETIIKHRLKSYIIQSNHDETFKVSKKSMSIFDECVEECEVYNFKNNYVGNLKNEPFPYLEKVTNLISEYINKGMDKKKIEELVLKTKVGYFRENANPRVVMEKRIKNLMVIDKEMMCWDNKPKHTARMNRYYKLVDELKNIK